MNLLKRLFAYVKPYRIRFLEALICMALVAGLTSLLMYMIKPTFDKIFAQKNAEMIPYIILIIICCALAKGVFQYYQSYLMAYIGQRTIMDIRNKLYSHLQSLSLDYFIRQRTGQIISRLTNDVMLLQRAIVSVPANLIRGGLTVIGLTGLLFYLQWRWAIIIMVVFPLVILPLRKFGKRLRKISRKSQEKMADIYSLLQEKILGIMMIKSFCMEKVETEKFGQENSSFFKIIMKAMRVVAIQSPVMEFIATLGMVGVLVIAGYEVINGKTTIGTFFAFVAAISSMYKPVKNFANLNQQIQQALAASERIFYVLDTKSFVVELPDAKVLPPLKEKIVLEEVSFSYPQEGSSIENELVLENINLEVSKGEILALVGPSGGGKTTIANLIPRFYDPTRGRIIIDGQDIRELTLKSLRKQMGIVTQETILFNDTVRNNIAYGDPEAPLERIVASARIANAHEFIMKLPQGYETVIGERGVKLSGGQKQRIAIARAVLKDPEILIFDEATSSLDSESELLVQEALDRLMKNHTTFVIAHRLSTIRKADRIIVIDRGRIVEGGKHRELMERSGLYRKLYDLQFREDFSLT
ncbi:MAG: ABC transporter ATP-binding protein [bacterium]